MLSVLLLADQNLQNKIYIKSEKIGRIIYFDYFTRIIIEMEQKIVNNLLFKIFIELKFEILDCK
jgi:hypothetical protein